MNVGDGSVGSGGKNASYEWTFRRGDLDVTAWKPSPWWKDQPGKDCATGEMCVRVAANRYSSEFGWWPQPCRKKQPYLCVRIVPIIPKEA